MARGERLKKTTERLRVRVELGKPAAALGVSPFMPLAMKLALANTKTKKNKIASRV